MRGVRKDYSSCIGKGYVSVKVYVYVCGRWEWGWGRVVGMMKKYSCFCILGLMIRGYFVLKFRFYRLGLYSVSRGIGEWNYGCWIW